MVVIWKRFLIGGISELFSLLAKVLVKVYGHALNVFTDGVNRSFREFNINVRNRSLHDILDLVDDVEFVSSPG